MKYNYLFIFYFLFTIHFINAQNTVGIINNTDAAYHGYTLFAPNNSTHTYLINNCGELVNKWTSTGTPAASVYLLENGNLLRTGKVANTEITFGGVGGKLELFDWDNNLLWSYNYSSNLISQHHDVYPLPNGNILMLAVTTMTAAEAITEGRDPSLLTDSKLFNEQILELEPVGANGANIVWEWNIKDHLIQDFDVTKNNFGVVTDHPELLNVNFLNGDSPVANWLHINSIQYNSSLDQIILSSRKMSEIYIIDHSTTIAESGSHSGGTYGKGGDFLFRWGNTIAYNKGTALDQKLFGQHFPHWIDDSFIDGGKIIVFNNGLARAYSSVDIISPNELTPGVYEYDTSTGFLPNNNSWEYTSSPNQSDFFSSIISGAERLPNGNTLICEGTKGKIFEINQAKEIVWEYINPDTNTGILTQGDSPSGNFVFRAKKIALDHPALTGRDLTATGTIETNITAPTCTLLNINEFDLTNLKIYPNPTNGLVTIESKYDIDKIEVYNIYGKLINTYKGKRNIALNNLNSGIYLLKIYSGNTTSIKKIIKQ